MAVTAAKFNALADHLGQKRIDIDSDTIKVMLLSAYTPDVDGHVYLADALLAVGSETSGTGYTAGGNALTGVTWTKTAGVWALKGTIPAWNATGGSLTARYALFYDATPATNDIRPLICYWNLNGGADVTATNDTFTLTPHASGIITIS